MARAAYVALVVAATTTGCEASLGRYERMGTAGAIVATSGMVVTVAGRQMWEGNHQEAGVATLTTGAAMQVTGLLLVLYALDGLILGSSGTDPALGGRNLPLR